MHDFMIIFENRLKIENRDKHSDWKTYKKLIDPCNPHLNILNKIKLQFLSGLKGKGKEYQGHIWNGLGLYRLFGDFSLS